MKRKDILFLLISATILTIIWVIFNIVHQNISASISENINQQILPIKANFDQQTIDAIMKRPIISPNYNLKDIVPTPTPTPLPTPTPTPIIFIFQNPTPNITAPVATQGGLKKP